MKIWEPVWTIREWQDGSFCCWDIRFICHLVSQVPFFYSPFPLVWHTCSNNPGANKKPDASNFLFLAQMYGGINITTGQAVPASAVMSGDEEGPRTTNTDTGAGTGTSAQDTPQGGGRRSRMLWGKSMVDSAIAITNLRSFSPSKVILSEPEQRRRRRILIANDFFEVHQVLEVNENLLRLQIYLLA